MSKQADTQLQEAIERRHKRDSEHERRSAASRKAAKTRKHRMKSPKWDWKRPEDPLRFDPCKGGLSTAPTIDDVLAEREK
jgi:hypothetical protein